MATNNRIFYACQAVNIHQSGTAAVAASGSVKGVQSLGMSANFTLDQVFEMGQLEIYENIEDVADIEVTLEKVIDGDKFIWEFASNNLCRSTLAGAAKNRCDVYLAIYDDATDNATGTPRNVCFNSGMYTSSVSYSYSIDGSATESVTLVGNERFWNAEHGATTKYGTPATGFDTDVPADNVQRRVNVDLENGSTALPDIVKSQMNPDTPNDEDGIGASYHIQSISVSADFGQENILELGRFGPYARFASFPIEVTTEFEVISTSGDLQNVSGNGTNLTNQPIKIYDHAGTVLDMGLKNKLSSVSYSGADTGGGNATVSYSFSNFNNLTVTSGA
tara:strand:+ start:3491 stop:4492 length:1002 start_codon:yes stop_codon:yes gene_type:complete